MAKCNEAGLAIIRQYEGCELTAYQDAGAVWTVGYGHTGTDVYEGMKISQARAESLLKTDVESVATAVQALVEVTLNPDSFSALCSFVYNVGGGAFADSMMRAAINAGNMTAAADEFSRWVYDNGEVLPGLVTRREAERALFLKGLL